MARPWKLGTMINKYWFDFSTAYPETIIRRISPCKFRNTVTTYISSNPFIAPIQHTIAVSIFVNVTITVVIRCITIDFIA